MKKLLIASILVFCIQMVFGQDPKQKIAIFAPLYLDSAFDNNEEYRFTKSVFPKYINPGLEFYEGAQLALDSLNKEGHQLEVFIYDTRSVKETLDQQLARPELRDVKLIIAHCSGNELRTLYQFANERKIPVINATVPNDGGAEANPYFVLLNPTLKTQCEGIYQYIQRYYSINPIVVFRRKGTADNMVKAMLDNYAKTTTGKPLKLKYVELIDSFTIQQLKAHIDTTRKTVILAGSLDMNFGKRLASHLAIINKDHPVVAVGMPTWDGIREFTRPEFKGLEIIYSTPFYNSRMDNVSMQISNYFNNTMFARPSDMVFRGYEATWNFARLLSTYKGDLASNLGNKQYHIFTDYDIQPVINRTTNTLDYFENKKLYFLKWQDGLIKAVQ